MCMAKWSANCWREERPAGRGKGPIRHRSLRSGGRPGAERQVRVPLCGWRLRRRKTGPGNLVRNGVPGQGRIEFPRLIVKTGSGEIDGIRQHRPGKGRGRRSRRRSVFSRSCGPGLTERPPVEPKGKDQNRRQAEPEEAFHEGLVVACGKEFKGMPEADGSAMVTP